MKRKQTTLTLLNSSPKKKPKLKPSPQNSIPSPSPPSNLNSPTANSHPNLSNLEPANKTHSFNSPENTKTTLKTTVVNVKVSNIRPQYTNLSAWCDDSNNLYIGRRGVVFIPHSNGTRSRYPTSDSILSNPFKIGKNVPDRETACIKFREYLENKLDKEVESGKEETGEFHVAVRNAVGKRLGCWCAPMRCHGDEIVRVINERGF